MCISSKCYWYIIQFQNYSSSFSRMLNIRKLVNSLTSADHKKLMECNRSLIFFRLIGNPFNFQKSKGLRGLLQTFIFSYFPLSAHCAHIVVFLNIHYKRLPFIMDWPLLLPVVAIATATSCCGSTAA